MNTNPGDWDGGGLSFSKQALAAAGVTAGGTISHGGLTFTWPAQAGTGSADNTVAAGQTIAVSGSGTLGFLVSASPPPGGNSVQVQSELDYRRGTVWTSKCDGRAMLCQIC